MLSVHGNNENRNNGLSQEEKEEVTDLLIDSKIGGESECDFHFSKKYDVLKTEIMGHKDRFYKKVLLKKSTKNECRSQSLPTSLDETDKSNGNLDVLDSCDTTHKLLVNRESPPSSPSSDLWFKTWPERYEKISCDNSDNSNVNVNKQVNGTVIDKINDSNFVSRKNAFKVTLNDALQTIPLAYSPVTKQLHYVDTNLNKSEAVSDLCECNEGTEIKKKGHHRTNAGSFSSTISTLSNPSSSGSLLEGDDRLSCASEEYSDREKKNGISNFFSRYVKIKNF